MVSALPGQVHAARSPAVDGLWRHRRRLHRPDLRRAGVLPRLLRPGHLRPQPRHRVSLAAGRPRVRRSRRGGRRRGQPSPAGSEIRRVSPLRSTAP